MKEHFKAAAGLEQTVGVILSEYLIAGKSMILGADRQCQSVHNDFAW